MEQLSGPQLFLRYAWPCANDRLHAGLINQRDFDELEILVKRSAEPGVILLALCFPNAVRELRNFASEDNMWFSCEVEKFWRHNHGHEGDCAVRMLTVVGIKGQMVATGLAKPFVNLYGLKLEIVDTISVHRGVVIEKIEFL